MIRSTRMLGMWLATLTIGSCTYDQPLRRVSFAFHAGGVMRDPSGPPTIHTLQGWDVTLTSAQLSLGPIYFRNQPANGGTGEALGRVVSEVLAIFDVDVLNPAPRVIAAGGIGTNEPALTAEVRLAEDANGPIADVATAGVAVARIAGFAVREGTVVPFAGTLALPMGGSVTAHQAFLYHEITQVPASFTADDGGTLTLRVDPAQWFDMVDFSALASRGSPPFDFASPAATTQLLSGVAGTNSFHFEWTDAHGP